MLARCMGLGIASVAARLLARPILHEYDAFHSGGGSRNPASIQTVEAVAACRKESKPYITSAWIRTKYNRDITVGPDITFVLVCSGLNEHPFR